jgi:hypothetical protein
VADGVASVGRGSGLQALAGGDCKEAHHHWNAQEQEVFPHEDARSGEEQGDDGGEDQLDPISSEQRGVRNREYFRAAIGISDRNAAALCHQQEILKRGP